jgi:predicted Fe-S protein YdhL (DUF1289 family)
VTTSGDGAEPVEAASPCVRVCKYNPHHECFGCFRTDVEVRSWNRLSPPERQVIVAQLDDRRDRYWARFTSPEPAMTST